jgi:hypothetical protein
MDDAAIFQLLKFCLRRYQFLAVQFSKLASDGWPLSDDVVYNVMADQQ